MLQLADALARALAAWESDTTCAAGLAGASPSVRPGYRVQRAAIVIAANLPAAMTSPYGVVRACDVLDLTDRLTDHLKLAALTHQLAAPCPHCNARALVRRDGADNVVCRMCQQSWPEHHYALLARMVVAASTIAADTPVTDRLDT
jgi:hypothetical protein